MREIKDALETGVWFYGSIIIGAIFWAIVTPVGWFLIRRTGYPTAATVYLVLMIAVGIVCAIVVLIHFLRKKGVLEQDDK